MYSEAGSGLTLGNVTVGKGSGLDLEEVADITALLELENVSLDVCLSVVVGVVNQDKGLLRVVACISPDVDVVEFTGGPRSGLTTVSVRVVVV